MPRRPLSHPPLALATEAPPRRSPDPLVARRPARRAGEGRRTASRNAPAPAPTRARAYLAVVGIALALGGLSLLLPSTPSYDPWSWTLWAREVVHGHLVITSTGTSWKPLPMIATIPFALTGGAAPDLWLVVARAGFLAALVFVFRLAHRLTLGLSARPAALPAKRRGPRAPALLAGVAAVVGLGLAPSGFASASALGYSEGVATALLLAAVELHLDARHRAAFGLGFLVALDRPEAWLLWVPYGLWLARRDSRIRLFVLVAFALQPLLWFGPVYLGSGHLGASVTRAAHPRANSDAFATDPFTAELRAGLRSVPLRMRIAAAAWLLVAVAVAGRALAIAGGRTPRGVARDPRLRALVGPGLIGLCGLVWLGLIAVMTELGFSGNGRYLVLGAALIDVAAGVAFGGLAVGLARLLPRVRATGGVAVTVAGLVFLLVPGWIGDGELLSLPRLHGALAYQARLRGDLGRVIAADGGRRHVLSCGTVMTEGFQVPMVAYALDVATTRISAPPTSGADPGRAPNLVLQTHDTRGGRALPKLRWWPRTPYVRHPGRGPFRLFTRCGTSS